ncbi:dienelactone hydrolase family protein [Massilia forsythiae]|uniref:Dienelactone hydrolase family protein n=1 Tax=Massilia forsythiae TaxID=2728020 RepID=A0A7Z2VU45_9BURK|nr:dienelactone hydrolase family protein [Massilia forsythiae]QJD99311.1 dienelactone hydrolase family protein [Massilia forsythiae]
MNDVVKDTKPGTFAVATLPVTSTVIHTDGDGLTAGFVDLEIAGQTVPVYRAQPAGRSNLPVLLVIAEIFGVHEHIADVARRFAKLGYLALAPQPFVRQGDPSTIDDIPTLFREIVSKAPDAQVMGDLDACVAWAAQNGGDTGRLGITGFCWGGRITWLYAAHNPQVKAGVAWYGRLAGDTNPNQTAHPVDVAPGLTVPVLGLYGAQDTGIPLDTVEAMKAALAKGSSGSEFVVYPDAGHAFYADYRPSYNERDAKDGFQRTLAWLKEHGAA